jgi:DNA helicase-2/ATP-dependent DNA helicase PcrA
MNLTDEQQEFVNDRSGHILALASAGAGKTHSLVYFIEDKIKYGIKPNQIISFSFTKKAANELKERVQKQFKKQKLQFDYISTIHSFCWNEIIKPFYKDFGYNSVPNVITDYQEIILDELYSKMKTKEDRKTFVNRVKTNIREDLQKEDFERVETAYLLEILVKNNMIMFDFMIHFANFALEEFPEKIREKMGDVKYILQDECQDSNKAQYRFLKLLQQTFKEPMLGMPYLVFVGDFKQSIYGFRGSDPKVIKSFYDEYNPKVHFLSYNFRSSPEIVEFANKFAENIDLGDDFLNQSKYQKYGGAVETGDVYKIFDVDEFLDELKLIEQPLHETCILARTNQTVKTLAKTLQLLQIPYYLHTEYDILKRIEVKFIMNLMNIVSSGYSKMLILETIKLAKGGIPLAISKYIDECHNMNDIKNKFNNIKKIDEIVRSYNYIRVGEFEKAIPIIADLFKNNTKTKENIEILLNRFLTDLKKIKMDNGYSTWMEALEDLLFEAQFLTKKQEGKVQLMTVHKAKGLQWNNVIFIYDMSILEAPEHNFYDIDEEFRVVYTAATRPKQNFVLWNVDNEMQRNLFMMEDLVKLVKRSIKKGVLDVNEFKKY